MRFGRWDVGCVLAGVRLHLEEVVGFIFNDEEVVLLRYGVDSASAGKGLGRAGGILAARNSVEEERFGRVVVCRWVPVAEDVIKRGGDEAFFVHLDADNANSHCAGTFDGCGESIFFA